MPLVKESLANIARGDEYDIAVVLDSFFASIMGKKVLARWKLSAQLFKLLKLL